MRLVFVVSVTMTDQITLGLMILFFTMMVIVIVVVLMFSGFDLVFIVPGRAVLDGMPMLTGMNVMRAASEKRMQQHRRNRQNAGQKPKHESFTVSRDTFIECLRHFVTSTQSELSLECESGQSGQFT